MVLLRPVHDLVTGFPDYEKFDLANQIRRAAKSVPTNIAEGYAKRRSAKDFRAYLAIAMGSATELEVHFEIAPELGYITGEQSAHFTSEYQIVARQLYRLIESWRKLDNKAAPSSRDAAPLRPPTSDFPATEA
jgi:four helix bundle protein